MASNDMHVVIYKILSYVYTCMKSGIEPDRDKISADALGIPFSYWAQIIGELCSHGYIEGISVTRTTAGPDVSFAKPRVTLDGVEFLMENSMMAKAKSFLQDVKSVVPGW